MQAATTPVPAASGSPFPATTGHYQPVTQTRPIPKASIDPASLMRVLGHGMEKWKVSNVMQRFKELPSIVDAYMRNRTHQQTYYANNELDRTYMDQNDFGQAHCLSLFEIEILLRYLLLVDKIHAFVPAKLGFCIFNRSFDRRGFQETWTKANLIDLDNYMRGIKQIPEPPANFTEEEKANLKER